MTVSPPWLSMPITQPINGVAYWISLCRIFSTPFIATWIEDDLEWEIDTLLWRIPWYLAPYYRIQ